MGEILVSPVLPEEAANLAASRRRRRGRPRHPSVHWSEDLVTKFEPYRWQKRTKSQSTRDESREDRWGYGTKVPGVSLNGLGVELQDYYKIIRKSVDYTESEVRQSVESFYNRSNDAESMGFRPPLNIRVVCEVKGPKGKVAIPAIIDTCRGVTQRSK